MINNTQKIFFDEWLALSLYIIHNKEYGHVTDDNFDKFMNVVEVKIRKRELEKVYKIIFNQELNIDNIISADLKEREQ